MDEGDAPATGGVSPAQRLAERLALDAFDQIVEATGAERERRLAALDDELRERVQRLLEAVSAESELDTPLAEVAPNVIGDAFEAATFDRQSEPGPSPDASSSEQPISLPESIGSWKVIGLLGRGGMGRVLRVERDLDGARQVGALKILRMELADAVLVRRFARERSILARLEHPAIARLIDGGVTEERLPFLVMELVEDGVAIDEWVESNQSSLPQVLDLFLQVCNAAQSAHARLILHRDIKPSNIVMVGSRAAPSVKLLDFGVGKILDEDDAPSARATTRLAPATPSYAAPEQLLGDDVTVQTDVYALGSLLYKLLSGRAPFRLEDTSPRELIRRAELEPEPLHRVARRPGLVRGDLENIVAKAMDLEPRRRYSTVEALAEDVRRFLSGRPVGATPSTLGYRLGKAARRHRVALGLATVFLATVGLGAGATLWQAQRAEQQARRAERTAAFLESLLIDANLGGNNVTDPSLSALLERGVERVDRDLGDEPTVRAKMRRLLGMAFQGLDRKEQARELFEQAEAEAVAAFGPESSEVAWNRISLANLRTEIDDQSVAADMQSAYAMLERIHGWPSEPAVEALNLVANKLRQVGDLEGALDVQHKMLDGARMVHGERSAWAAAALGNLGTSFRQMGQPAESLPFLSEAVAIYDELGLGPTTTGLRLRNNLAVTQHELGQLRQAEEQYRISIALKEERLGSEHEDLAPSLSNLARVLMDGARFAEALPSVERAVRIQERSDPGSIPAVAARINLASLLMETGGVGAAVELHRDAYSRFEQALGSGHMFTRLAGWRLADALFVEGDLAQAEPLYAAFPEGGRPAAESAGWSEPFLGLGRVANERGAHDVARAHLEDALRVGRGKFGDEHWRLAEIRAELALAGGTPALDDEVGELRSVLPIDNWRLARLERLRAEQGRRR